MGIIGILSMLRPYLVDKGYDMKEIGFLTGIVGTAASFVMAWFSGSYSTLFGFYFVLLNTPIYLFRYFYILF